TTGRYPRSDTSGKGRRPKQDLESWGISALSHLSAFLSSQWWGCRAMRKEASIQRFRTGWGTLCLGVLAWACSAVVSAWADPNPQPADPTPHQLSLDSAIRWALEHNPELAAIRQRHGVAAAGVVIARTYPYNPFFEGRVQGIGAPESAGVTNRVNNEYKLF